ncbi:MAG TPA: GNAT family N-acetyltransferase [Blastocatellia bacterium]|nr:GNAT family N-acetyltransferase [Blastocatellia bacterium]
MDAPAIKTARLLLRPLEPSDFEAYAAFSADPDVMRYIAEGRPLTREEAWRNMAMMIGHWHLRGYGNWAVEERSTGSMIGRLGFWNPEGWPGFELGWLIARTHWGQGYATEGARAALDFAFAVLGERRVISLIRPGNRASIRVAEKIGEQYEQTLDLRGDALLYSISV